MTKLYHKDIFIPASVLNFDFGGLFRLVYTRHAMKECLQDKLGQIGRPPCLIDISKATIIEAEVTDEIEVTKLVIRLSYDNTRDIILVLRNFFDGAATVITLWTNSIKDTHNTLDRSKYETL
jgi:hypothetical protein